jgi:hypothetical protein
VTGWWSPFLRADAWFGTTNVAEGWFDQEQIGAPAGGSITAAIAESQAVQTESIGAAERYSAVIAESQAAQSEAIVAAEKYSATIAEAQAAQSESITAAERYAATVIESQAAQVEAITAVNTPFIPVQKPQQLVGMGGRWYTYRELFAERKRELAELQRLEGLKAEKPVQPKEPEPDPVFVSRMAALGSRQRSQIVFHPLDLSEVRQSLEEHETIAARRSVRRRREREAVEV